VEVDRKPFMNWYRFEKTNQHNMRLAKELSDPKHGEPETEFARTCREIEEGNLRVKLGRALLKDLTGFYGHERYGLPPNWESLDDSRLAHYLCLPEQHPEVAEVTNSDIRKMTREGLSQLPPDSDEAEILRNYLEYMEVE
jgi:hypothetical protein